MKLPGVRIADAGIRSAERRRGCAEAPDAGERGGANPGARGQTQPDGFLRFPGRHACPRGREARLCGCDCNGWS